MSRALDALLDYRQADEDGVIVLVSRQAVHEVEDEVKRLRGALEVIAATGIADPNSNERLHILAKPYADIAREALKDI